MSNTTTSNAFFNNHSFTETQVANRYALSKKTLQLWRMNGEGPRFLKIGRAIRYLASDLSEFEAESKKSSTSK